MTRLDDTMKMLISIAALALATAGQSATPRPPVERMTSVAYHVPETQIDAGVSAMHRYMGVTAADTPRALGALAACRQEGMLKMGDMLEAVRLIGPTWATTVHQPHVDAAFGVRPDGVADVSRLCGTLQNARRGFGSAHETIAAVKDAIAGTDDSARVTRALMMSTLPRAIDGEALIRTDYDARIGS